MLGATDERTYLCESLHFGLVTKKCGYSLSHNSMQQLYLLGVHHFQWV